MGDIIFICKFNRISGTIRSENITCYNDLVRAVRSKFFIGDELKVELHYSMAVVENSVLENDDDYCVMLLLLEGEKRGIIHIDVTATSRALVCVSTNSDNLLATSTSISADDSSLVEASSSCITSKEPLLSTNWKYSLTGIGQRFLNSKDFRVALGKYASEKGFNFVYKKNNSKNVTAICLYHEQGCCWRVSATYREAHKGLEVSKFDKEHTCQVTRAPTGERLTQKIVADLVVDKMKDEHKSWKPKDVMSYMFHSYGHDVSYMKGWRALKDAKENAFGKEDDTYTKLQWYIRAALALNPNSYIFLEIERPTNVFQRLFVAWGSSIQGYKFVRPLISLDATHLKGKHEGVLIAATAKTANQELYPIAYAVVNIENGVNWRWFLQHLNKIVDHEARPITFLSDRNPGLLEAVPLVFPSASHYYCLYHLRDNLRSKYNSCTSKEYKDYVVSLFNNVAYASTFADYVRCRSEFESKGGPAAKFLDGLDPSHWCNAFSQGFRYGETTSSASESFNSCIRDDRELPVSQLVEKVRERLMRWVHERSTKAAKWKGYLTKEMETRIEDLIQLSRKWQIRQASAYIFEVMSKETCTVDLEKQTCTCRRWSFKGYPCAHAVRVIVKQKLPMQEFLDNYWLADTYRKCYALPIMPVPTTLEKLYSFDEDPYILPPYFVVLPGRPSKKRKKSKAEREDTRKMMCGNCKQLGHHNKRGCPVVFTPSPQAPET